METEKSGQWIRPSDPAGIFQILKERNQNGATVFLSSHVLPEVQKYCSHAAIIRDGKVLVSDSVERIGHSGVKRVTLHGIRLSSQLSSDTDCPASALMRSSHIRNLTAIEDGVRFLYEGNAAELLKLLSPLPITDLTVTEPDLEEIVMHYYQSKVLRI